MKRLETVADRARRPPLVLLALEGRAVAEYGAFLASGPLISRAPRGDGHPVLVLPGWSAGDRSTAALRSYLRNLDHRVHGWRLGRNMGPDDITVDALRRRFLDLNEQAGTTVSVVGWSLGGVYARWLGRQYPDRVRRVVTLGAPFRATSVGHSNVSMVFMLFGRRPGDELIQEAQLPEQSRPPLTMPATSIYSRFDGAVPPAICHDAPGPGRESIEVFGSHAGLGHLTAAVYATADRLALPAGELPPFVPPKSLRRCYGRIVAAG